MKQPRDQYGRFAGYNKPKPTYNQPLTELLHKIGNEPADSDKATETRLDGVLRALTRLVNDGDMNAIKYVGNRLDGRPHEAIEYRDEKRHTVVRIVDGEELVSMMNDQEYEEYRDRAKLEYQRYLSYLEEEGEAQETPPSTESGISR